MTHPYTPSNALFDEAFNAFATSRWRNVPMNCNSIPDEYSDMRGWCVDVQALKAFVWIEFVARTSPFAGCLRSERLQRADYDLVPHNLLPFSLQF